MTAMSGYINYIEYSTSVDKGQSKNRFISSPFGYGDVDVNYTSEKVVEEDTLDAATTVSFGDWTPVVPGTVDITVGTDRYLDDGNGKLYLLNGAKVTRRLVTDVEEDGVYSGVPAHVVVTFGAEATEAGTVNYTTGITFTTAVTGDSVLKYSYNNVVVPQNALPMIKAEMKMMPLLAKARRIAIYYSQIAAFQAKNDYGFDLADQLAEKAVGELSYEIDTEITQLLIDNAAEDADLVWSKTLPVGVKQRVSYAIAA